MTVDVPLKGESEIAISYDGDVELLPPEIHTRTGDTNKGLKIISTEWKNNELRILVDGLSGEPYDLGVVNARKIRSVKGGEMRGDNIHFQIPQGPPGEFQRFELVLSTM